MNYPGSISSRIFLLQIIHILWIYITFAFDNANKMRFDTMRKNKEYIGIIITATGALMLVGEFLSGCKNANAALLTALAFIILGIAIYVAISKKNSRY